MGRVVDADRQDGGRGRSITKHEFGDEGRNGILILETMVLQTAVEVRDGLAFVSETVWIRMEGSDAKVYTMRHMVEKRIWLIGWVRGDAEMESRWDAMRRNEWRGVRLR